MFWEALISRVAHPSKFVLRCTAFHRLCCILLNTCIQHLGEGTGPSSSVSKLSTVGRASSSLVPFLLGFSSGGGLPMMSEELPFS